MDAVTEQAESHPSVRLVDWFNMLIACRNKLHGSPPARQEPVAGSMSQGVRTTHVLGWSDPSMASDVVEVDLMDTGQAYACLRDPQVEATWNSPPDWETTLHGDGELVSAMTEVDRMYRERGILPLEACALADAMAIAGFGPGLVRCPPDAIDAYVSAASSVSPAVKAAEAVILGVMFHGVPPAAFSWTEATNRWKALVRSLPAGGVQDLDPLPRETSLLTM